jgi:hypothetical protein
VPKSIIENDGSKQLRIIKLGDALNLKYDSNIFYICRDHKTSLEHLFSGKNILDHGFFLHLQGYQYKLFWDFREVYDATGTYQKIYEWLQGRGVSSIADTIKEHTLIPVHRVMDELYSNQIIEEVNSFCFDTDNVSEKTLIPGNVIHKMESLIYEINHIESIPLNKDEVITEVKNDLSSTKYFFETWIKALKETKSKKLFRNINDSLGIFNSDSGQNRQVLFIINTIKNLNSKNVLRHDYENIFDRLWMGKKFAEFFDKWQYNHDVKERNISLIRCLSFHSDMLNIDFTTANKKAIKTKKSNTNGINDVVTIESILLNKIFDSTYIRNFLNYNEYDGIYYYSKERFENLMDWMFTLNNISFTKRLALNENAPKKRKTRKEKENDKEKEMTIRKKIVAHIKKNYTFFNNLKKASDKSGYKVEDLLKLFE